jgi:hypothetical protein
MGAIFSGLFMALLKDALSSLFQAIVSGVLTSQQQQRDEAALSQGAVSGAAAETETVIAGMADERARIPPVPNDPGALADRMRRNAAAARADGSRAN